MVAVLAMHVAGTVTGAFGSVAEQRAAYDFLANPAVTVEAIRQAIGIACATRCAAFPWVYVPVDGSSLAISDAHATRGTGHVGSRTAKGRGFIVQSAIAVTAAGVALGLCAQLFWTRTGKTTRQVRRQRGFEQKETRYWVLVAQQVLENFRLAQSICRPWFQFDRGGDVGDVLYHAVEHDWLITVRAAQNRRLQSAVGTPHLWPTLLRQQVLGRYSLQVPASPQRRARIARMSVRACKVTLRLTDRWFKRKPRTVTLGAVLTREVGTTPRDDTPIEWVLLTTHTVDSFLDAKAVVDGYTQRWKVELFHNLWKSGRCNVEDTHLSAATRIQKWATLLASIAMRTLHLTHKSRETPDLPADEVLTRDEIDTIILLRKPKGYKPGDTPTLGQAVRWIAEFGGFMSQGKGIPPGKMVIGRGLNRIAAAVDLLKTLRAPKKTASSKRRGQ
jgi:hypothetical protein